MEAPPPVPGLGDLRRARLIADGRGLPLVLARRWPAREGGRIGADDDRRPRSAHDIDEILDVRQTDVEPRGHEQEIEDGQAEQCRA
jgi:hypothetical protein